MTRLYMQAVASAALLLSVLAFPGAQPPERGVAASADEIRPLLIGAEIPDVTVAALSGEPVALRGILAKQPTILVYYRGGW